MITNDIEQVRERIGKECNNGWQSTLTGHGCWLWHITEKVERGETVRLYEEEVAGLDLCGVQYLPGVVIE